MSTQDTATTTTDVNDTPGESDEVAAAHPLARFFFLRTTFALLLVALLALGGVAAYLNLVQESIPDLDIPQATVTTTWPGADPQTIEEQLTRPLEDELTTLKGLKSLTSASFDSFSVIAVEFRADADSGEAMQRLREAIADAEAELPEDAEAPDIQQVSVDDRPIMTLTLFGGRDARALNALAEDIKERVERVAGVNEVGLGGARDEVVQILLDPARLLALGIPPTAVRQAITTANLEQPFGEIDSETIGSVVRLEGQFQSVEDLLDLPIARLNSGVTTARSVRLGEIGTVERRLEREDSRAFFSQNGGEYAPTIEIGIKKAPGADTVQLVANVSAQLEAWRDEGGDWPGEIDYAVTQNEAEQIRDSLSGVFVNGLQSMLAVFVILLVVLSWREGLVAGLSIPISFAGTLVAIWALGYTLNELVIIGMVLALGLLVDVFILMMEGLHEEIYSRGRTFGQAALATIKHYGVPAFAGQLTTILALAPLMAIGGTSGKFIRVLPVTAIACLVVAFAVALLASVPLSRYVLGSVARSGADDKETGADRAMTRLSSGLRRWSLSTTLVGKRTAALWVGGAVIAFALSIVAATRIPIVLYPATDGLNLGINVELPPATSLATSQRVADGVGTILADMPWIESVIELVGRKSPLAAGSIGASLQPSEAENFIGFSVRFVEREARDAPSHELAELLRREIGEHLAANVPGASLLVVPESSGPTTGDPIEIELTGEDMGTLQRLSAQVREAVRKVPGTADVRDNLGAVKGEIALVADREALDFHGLTQLDLAAQIRFALSNDRIGTFATLGPEDDLDLLMSLDWGGEERRGPATAAELAMVRAFTPTGETVSLLALLKPEVSEAPTSVTHIDGERALSVLSKLDGRPLADVIADIEPQLERLAAKWPAGYGYSIGGESEETAETFGSAGLMLAIALVMVFGVLVIVFNSFAQGFILLATMPLALIGTFLGFWVTGMALSFFAVVGVIALIGIVANNGIVMIDTMNERLDEGASVAEAAADGAAARLRPIVTTSVTTVAGLLPLALGSPMYAPLCYAIVFGLVSSTALSLVIVPCLYVLLTNAERRRGETLD